MEIMTQFKYDDILNTIPDDGLVLKNENLLTLNIQKYKDLNENSIKHFYDWMLMLRSDKINNVMNASLYKSGRSTKSNEMTTKSYYDSFVTPSNKEEFLKTIVGSQLNESILTNNNFVAGLDEICKNNDESNILKDLFGFNLRTGFTFGNNFDCLFQSTFGIFTALWHNSELNNGKKYTQFNGDYMEKFYNNVIIPFKQSDINQIRNTTNLKRYLNKIVTSRYNITLDPNKIIEDLKKILTLDDINLMIKFNNPTFDDFIDYFIKRVLKREPEFEELHNQQQITVREYYTNRIIHLGGLGQEFIDDFMECYNELKPIFDRRMNQESKNKKQTKKAKEESYKAKLKNYNNDRVNNELYQQFIENHKSKIDTSLTNFENYLKETLKSLEVHNYNDIENTILSDYESDNKTNIKNFFDSALNFIEDVISSINYDNFIFSSMVYRATCLMLMYWFIPDNLIDDDLELQTMIWDSNPVEDVDTYKQKDYPQDKVIKPVMSQSFIDIDLTIDDDDSINYKTYMIFNEVFTMVAMKLFPSLTNVRHIRGQYNNLVDENINCLYIIRPIQHDHTFTIAKVNDEIFWCDDVHVTQFTAIQFLTEDIIYTEPSIDSERLSNKLIKDLYDYLLIIYEDEVKGYYKYPSFLSYYNDNTLYFIHYIMFSNYHNVLRSKITYDSFNELWNEKEFGDFGESDLSETMTNQIYGSNKNKNMFAIIFDIIKLFILILLVIISIIIVVEIINIRKHIMSANR